MTCAHADENFPLVLGASARIPNTYDDPKDFDGTPHEADKYEERVHQIGREILYAFSRVEDINLAVDKFRIFYLLLSLPDSKRIAAFHQ